MGSFRTPIEIENPALPGTRAVVGAALVDTGAELSWIPETILESLGIAREKISRFRQADGSVIERAVGGARIFAAGTFTLDDVVFALHGDLTILGARSLEGLNVRVEPATKRLVDAGPAPAAAASPGASPQPHRSAA